MHGCFVRTYVCVCHLCAVPTEVRRGYQVQMELQRVVSCHVDDRNQTRILSA